MNDRSGSKFCVWDFNNEDNTQCGKIYILSNGNVLIFDNGVHRFDEPMPYSRIIEINPVSKEIIWEYSDKPKFNYCSSLRMAGKRITSLMLTFSVKSITKRSTPIPTPPVGGIPHSTAWRKFSSTGWASSSPSSANRA